MDTRKNSIVWRRLAAASVLLAIASVAMAAKGYIVTKQQQAAVHVGMSRDDVRKLLGRPAHNLKYRNEPGLTWSYGVDGTPDTVFDIDFTTDGKVKSTSQRVEKMD